MNTVVMEKRRHRIVTPEGLPLALEIASFGDRVGAMVLDWLAMCGLTVVAAIVLGLLASLAGREA